MNKFAVMVEETDSEGNTTDFFPAHDFAKEEDVVYDNINDAVEYIYKECGRWVPFCGKYTYHIYEIDQAGEFVQEKQWKDLVTA